MVKACDYLYLNKEIHFAEQLEMSEPGADESSGIKPVLSYPR